MEVTAFEIAERFVGTGEVRGTVDNPIILAMLRLDQSWPGSDEVPWCSAFVNWVAWLLRLPRSKNLAARSWLEIGAVVQLAEARPGFDVVVLERGADPRSGHVGFFAGLDGASVIVLGGNQGDRVSMARFPIARVIGVRRLRASA